MIFVNRFWHWIQVRFLCDQGIHGDHIITIEENERYENYCTRCGLVTLVEGENIYWGHDDRLR